MAYLSIYSAATNEVPNSSVMKPISGNSTHSSMRQIIAGDSMLSVLSSPVLKNIYIYADPKSPAYPSPSRPAEGRIMIVSYVGHGMRWTRQRWRARGSRGGFARERLAGAWTNKAVRGR